MTTTYNAMTSYNRIVVQRDRGSELRWWIRPLIRSQHELYNGCFLCSLWWQLQKLHDCRTGVLWSGHVYHGLRPRPKHRTGSLQPSVLNFCLFINIGIIVQYFHNCLSIFEYLPNGDVAKIRFCVASLEEVVHMIKSQNFESWQGNIGHWSTCYRFP